MMNRLPRLVRGHDTVRAVVRAEVRWSGSRESATPGRLDFILQRGELLAVLFSAVGPEIRKASCYIDRVGESRFYLTGLDGSGRAIVSAEYVRHYFRIEDAIYWSASLERWRLLQGALREAITRGESVVAPPPRMVGHAQRSALTTRRSTIRPH